MPSEERLGASFSIDITALKTGLQQANRLIKESNSEFKAAAAGLDDWTKSEEGLTAKLKNLNDVADVQGKKVSALQKEYDRCIADGLDPMSAAAVKMRTDINNEKAALAKTQSEINKYQKALDELADTSEDAAESVEDVGEAAKDSGDNFTVTKGAIAGFISNGLTALVGACKNAISSVLGLAEATREYREDMAKLETAFSVTGHKQADAQKAYEDFYAILGESDRSVEAVNHLAELTNSQEELSKWSTIAAGVTAKFGDSLPIEGLTEAANETAKVGKVTGPLADALNWAGESEDEFNEKLEACNSEQERSQLITETLNGLYEDAAKKYNKQTKSQQDARRATAELEAAQSELGDTIEPITTKFTELKTKALNWLIDEGLPAAKEGFEWIKENATIIEAGIAGIAAAFVGFKVVSLIQSVTAALNGMSLAQAALNLVMSLNPIGLVVAAVAALIAIIVVLWKKSDKFREFFINMWEGTKKVVSSVGDYFVKIFNKAVEKIKGFFSGLGDFFGGLWTTIKNKFSSLGEAIGSAISGAVKGAINSVIRLIEIKINSAIGLINGAIGLINKIPVIGGSVKKLSEVSLPRLATGGVVSGATAAIIGEDGAEAVVPLEKNKQWIKAVADEMAAQGKQNITINQTNNYAQAHTRYEMYKSKQQTAAAVRLALQGG